MMTLGGGPWRPAAALLCAAGYAANGVGAEPAPMIPGLSLMPQLHPLMENAGTVDLFPMSPCGEFKLEEATIDDMQEAMASGVLTSQQLVLCYLQRAYQTQEYINSILQVNPDVFYIAGQMDQERRRGKLRGPLHGIPFTVKDNMATKDNMETTAGSWALLGSIVPRDAHVVGRLREAGAVLFGKATLSEWADMRSNNYSEGYSGRGGQARSPYNFTVNPGGSSTGSATAVAANVVAFSLGTETDGSVINPAMRNSLVGIKPTVGLTSRAGVIPESEHQDSVGTFGKTVRDATYALDAIYGVDERDPYTLEQKGKTPRGGYAKFLSSKKALKGATFGLPWKSFWVYADEEQLAILGDILQLIEAAGATIVNETEIVDYETIVSTEGWNWDWGTSRGFPNESEYTVVKVDFYNNINAYLAELDNTAIKTFEDIVQYNFDNTGTEGGFPMPDGNPAFWSGQDGFLASLETGGEKDETYEQALEFVQRTSREGIDGALMYGKDMKRKMLDGLLVPPDVGQSYQTSAQAGYPIITVPAGVHSDSGMPFGLAILQTAYAEDKLIKYGSAIEDLLKETEYTRVRPKWRGYLERNIPVPF